MCSVQATSVIAAATFRQRVLASSCRTLASLASNVQRSFGALDGHGAATAFPWEEQVDQKRRRPLGPGRDEGPLPEYTKVVNALRRDQVVRGVRVGGLDEDGHGVVHLYVRKDRQAYEYKFEKALPGDQLHLRVESAKHNRYNKKEAGRYRLAVDEWGGASPDEVVPVCQHFKEKCGGCAIQHLAYDAQIREKHALLRSRLEQYGLDRTELRPTVASPASTGFHSRTEFRFFLQDGPRLGLHQAGSPLPVEISKCELQPSGCQEAFAAVVEAVRSEPDVQVFSQRTGQGWLCGVIFRASVRTTGGKQEVLVTLVTTASAPMGPLRNLATATAKGCSDIVGVGWSPSGGEQHAERTAGWRSSSVQQHGVLWGRSFLVHDFLGHRFETVPEAFVRPNVLLADSIYSTVLELSEIKPNDVVWDAFCGQGPLAIAVARQCKELVALDRSEPALVALRANLSAYDLASRSHVLHVDLGNPAALRSITGVGNIDTGFQHTQQLTLGQDESDDELDEVVDDEPLHAHRPMQAIQLGSAPLPDVVIADPGRNGMPKAFRRLLYKLDARMIVIIGGGKTLLRDIKLLTRRGYELCVMQPFDSHPHTARLEVVAQMRRRSRRRTPL